MSLEKTINDDIKKAMLAREKDKLEALRAIKSAVLIEKTGKYAGEEIPEDVELKLLQRLVKQRKEAGETYVNQNRQDLADVEFFQANLIETYLPAQMSEDDIKKVVAEVIAQTGASGMKDMGKVMGICAKQLAGKADNKVVSQFVKELLG
ncbi:MAG: GatB/YqeY domain-containing protein [Saprospiraceae bacterium]|nr:GatB/YqeY domain-containing protein [Saprospiraceae bacterium]